MGFFVKESLLFFRLFYGKTIAITNAKKYFAAIIKLYYSF